MRKDFDYIQWASGNFLVVHLPDGWRKMAEKEIEDFVEENSCATYEDLSGAEVLMHIEELAKCLRMDFYPKPSAASAKLY